MSRQPKPDEFDIDLDRLEGRFRSVSIMGTAYAGYITLFILIGLVACVLGVPAGLAFLAYLGATNTLSDPFVAIGFGLGGLIFVLAYVALFYWLLAETLRLNRVIAAFLIVQFVMLSLTLLIFGVLGVVDVFGAITGAAPQTEGAPAFDIGDATNARIFYASQAFVAFTIVVVTFVVLRITWSYIAASFGSPAKRRMLVPVAPTDAKLVGGHGAFFGGGITIPTLRKGGSRIRLYNMFRSIFAGLAPIVLFLGLTNLIYLTTSMEIGLILPLIIGAAFALLLGAAALFAHWARACLRAARKRARFSLDAMRGDDARAPTLFLRPFHDDQVELTRNQGKRTLLATDEQKRELDHILVEEFSWSGPIVAIGRPGEKELPFGAARTFLSNDVWQQEALALAAAAGEVVIVVDDTPGVQWEIEQVCGQALRGKTLFLFHPKFMSPEANRTVCQRIAHGLGIDVNVEGKPIVGLWLHDDGAPRVLRSTRFSVEAFTMTLRDFFRSRAALQKARDKALKRGGRGAQPNAIAQPA